MNKKLVGLGVVSLAALTFAACGSRTSTTSSSSASSDSAVKAAIVTDVGGVDDRSFNQSAWEGLTAWGEENGLSENTDYRRLASAVLSPFPLRGSLSMG